MTENWKIQASPKTPKGTLINIRAENGEEFKRGLALARENVQDILALEALFAGGTVLVEGELISTVAVSRPVEATQSAGNVTSIQEASPISPPAPPVTQSAAQPPGPACLHGSMSYVKSPRTSAKRWQAWMCSAPKDAADKCDRSTTKWVDERDWLPW